MISEIELAKGFSSFWADVLPLLTPSFVALFNEAYCSDISELPHSRFFEIGVGSYVERHDLLAEYAFCLAAYCNKNKVSATDIKAFSGIVSEAYDRAIRFLGRYKSANGEIFLNVEEIAEASRIAAQYEKLFSCLNVESVEFYPKVSGSGFLGACYADLAVDDYLYEVKTTTRNIRGKDIKQLFIYLSLQYLTGSRRWSKAGFFNPRRALLYQFDVEHLIYKVSGGRSSADVFSEIVDFLSSRSMEIDTVF